MLHELRPCPFCGGSAVTGRDETGLVYIGCETDDCLCNIDNYSIFGPKFYTKEGARMVWNDRTESAEDSGPTE